MYVYTITHVESGKVYVGKSKVPRNRWARHKLDSATGDTMLYRAMRKHGVAAFKFEIVEQCPGDEESFEAEKRWVAKLESNVPGKGYNHTEGGPGMPRPDQVTRGRMGSGMRGKKQTPESVAKRAAANRGLKRTPETCALLSQRRREISDETRAKMSASARARQASPEVIAKRAASIRGNGKKADKMTRIRDAHSHGLSNNRIADRVGCTDTLVARYLKEMGLAANGIDRRRGADTILVSR